MKRMYLVELRKTMNLTQEEAAEKLGITQSSYSLIEGGQRRKSLSTDLLHRLAIVFEVDVFDIVAREALETGN